MSTKRHGRGRRVIVLMVAVPAMLCGLVVLALALSNLGLPTHSTVVDRLTTADKARLSEATHLRQTLGDQVWPGWGQVDVPYIVYNETYAFLVSYPSMAGGPPAGWVKMPQGQARGGPWQVVPGDDFEGKPYYRQALAGAGQTPEGFTVLVGNVWVATFQTKQYAEITFVSDLREQMPPVVSGLVPYRVLWGLLMGESEGYMAALLHESFHSYQAMTARARFAQAEQVMAIQDRYPWDAARSEWQSELDLISNAAQASTDAEAADLAQQFLAQRDLRRARAGLSADLIDLEGQREWLEGLAKYNELAIDRLAATTASYVPVEDLAQDPDFNHYATRARFWSEQLSEVKNMLNQHGEIRFYYTGLAQAAVLDRLLPGWKASAFSDGVWLEDLLRQATRSATVGFRTGGAATDVPAPHGINP